MLLFGTFMPRRSWICFGVWKGPAYCAHRSLARSLETISGKSSNQLYLLGIVLVGGARNALHQRKKVTCKRSRGISMWQVNPRVYVRLRS